MAREAWKGPKKIPTPREARTGKKIARMPRDNIYSDQFWAQLDEDTIAIAAQVKGEPTKVMINLSRDFFDELVDWYNTGTWVRHSAPNSATQRRRRDEGI